MTGGKKKFFQDNLFQILSIFKNVFPFVKTEATKKYPEGKKKDFLPKTFLLWTKKGVFFKLLSHIRKMVLLKKRNLKLFFK